MEVGGREGALSRAFFRPGKWMVVSSPIPCVVNPETIHQVINISHLSLNEGLQIRIDIVNTKMKLLTIRIHTRVICEIHYLPYLAQRHAMLSGESMLAAEKPATEVIGGKPPTLPCSFSPLSQSIRLPRSLHPHPSSSSLVEPLFL